MRSATLSEQLVEEVVEEDSSEPLIDTDGDCVVDSDDSCSIVPGKSTNNGCPPDSYGDGIDGETDEYPPTAGVLEKNEGLRGQT